MFSAMEVLSEEQDGSVMSVFDGSFGFHERPKKTAKVKMEFTWIMPSSALMWMVVPKGFSWR